MLEKSLLTSKCTPSENILLKWRQNKYILRQKLRSLTIHRSKPKGVLKSDFQAEEK